MSLRPCRQYLHGRPLPKPTRRAALQGLAICLAAAVYLMGGCAVPVEAPKPAAGARGPILSAVLAHADLQRFLHRDTHPDRFPLQVIDQANAGIAADDLQELAGTAVLVPENAAPDPQRAVFIIDALEVGEGTARLAFRFPIEGLSGVAALVATGAGGWRVNAMRLTET